MKNNTNLLVLLFAFALLICGGCGKPKYPSVSGVITVDGEPVSMVRVVFAPVSTADNHSPGPWAKGVTDETGRFVLRTRDGIWGAVVGTNSVGFEWDDISFDAMSELREQIELGTNVASANARLKEIKQKLASRIDLRTVKSPVFVVPAAGTSNADFELGE